MAEYMSDIVPATIRAVKVEALNSCSAYSTSEVLKIALLIVFYCPERRSLIQLINPPRSRNSTYRGDMW